MLRVLRWSLAACAFTVAFVINPMFVAGCMSDGDDEPSEADLAKIEAGLVAQLDDVNATGSFPFSYGGVEYELLVALTQQPRPASARHEPTIDPWSQVAHACGNKTFYASAAACFTVYELAVHGTLTLRRLGADAATVEADIPVRGSLTEYSLDLYFDGDAGNAYFGVSRAEFTLDGFKADNLGADDLSIDYVQ